MKYTIIALLVSILLCVLLIGQAMSGPGAWNCGELMGIWGATSAQIDCK